MSFCLEQCKFNFSSDNINIIVLVYDRSGSMSDNVYAIQEANQAFYADFSKFEERGSIAISKSVFNYDFWMSNFLDVKSFDTGYGAGGGTHLYSAIRKSVRNTISYYNEIVKRLNVRPRITFLVFTDGEDTEQSRYSYDEAKKAIQDLNSLDATTVFVAFDQAIYNKDGDALGFTCTRNITDVRELISCLGGELSKSCKEQSRSAYSLKSEFFSKASAEATDDSLTEQAIIDDDFFNV